MMISSLSTFNTATPIFDLPRNVFVDQVVARNLGYLRQSFWRTDVESKDVTDLLEKLCVGRQAVFFAPGQSEGTAALQLEGGLGWVSAGSGVTVETAFPEGDDSAHSAFVAEVKKLFPVEQVLDDKKARVRFWMAGTLGPTSVTRRIEVPDWGDIEKNYPDGSFVSLDPLMRDFRPSRGGQLLLWHGPPGTGKTFALRALAYEWRRWCDVEYVVDPEAFFGSAAYMMSVCLGDSRDEAVPEPTVSSDESPRAVHPLAEDGRWRLLLLEDAGELLTEDARERTGQGLSRFLNLSDGMLGQGLRVLSLVTTNEPLKKLHPAVSRPGRCAAEVEFRSFEEEAARFWLNEHGVYERPENLAARPTLADLFGAVEGFHGAKGHGDRIPVGFATDVGVADQVRTR